ncbi:hypothetical protein ACFPK1_12370 [Actinomycetospora rhizophila]|uniref:Uncharacterized protein n=1 Tax=Actinomycetospora rhizophila TaxID=1416876 RepID=A0ABV9ZF65_9PSEU
MPASIAQCGAKSKSATRTSRSAIPVTSQNSALMRSIMRTRTSWGRPARTLALMTLGEPGRFDDHATPGG